MQAVGNVLIKRPPRRTCRSKIVFQPTIRLTKGLREEIKLFDPYVDGEPQRLIVGADSGTEKQARIRKSPTNRGPSPVTLEAVSQQPARNQNSAPMTSVSPDPK
jgi:hypothetical protein